MVYTNTNILNILCRDSRGFGGLFLQVGKVVIVGKVVVIHCSIFTFIFQFCLIKAKDLFLLCEASALFQQVANYNMAKKI